MAMHVGGCDLEEHPGSTVWPCVVQEDQRYPWVTAVVFSSLLLLPVHVCAVLQLLVTAKLSFRLVTLLLTALP